MTEKLKQEVSQEVFVPEFTLFNGENNPVKNQEYIDNLKKYTPQLKELLKDNNMLIKGETGSDPVRSLSVFLYQSISEARIYTALLPYINTYDTSRMERLVNSVNQIDKIFFKKSLEKYAASKGGKFLQLVELMDEMFVNYKAHFEQVGFKQFKKVINEKAKDLGVK